MNEVKTVVIGPQPEAKDDDEAVNHAVGVAMLFALVGIALAIAGVYILFGIGWALIAGSIPTLILSSRMFKGLQPRLDDGA